MPTKKTAWGNLKNGDILVCPSDGHEERVVQVNPRRDGSVMVRTSRHDHFRDQHAQATLQSVDMDRLREILATMDVPESRREDWPWLRRNLGIRNQTHPDFDEAWNLLRVGK